MVAVFLQVMFTNVEYLFSYGSNNAKQLEERTGAVNLTPIGAFIPNYSRIFAGNSSYRNGGVASIYPYEGDRVCGSIVTLTLEELEKLDQYELGYNRERITVMLHETGEIIECHVYIRIDYIFQRMPSEEYLLAIHKNLQHVNLLSDDDGIVIRGVVKDKDEQEMIQSFGSWK